MLYLLSGTLNPKGGGLRQMAGLLSSQIQTILAPTHTGPEWPVALMAPGSQDCRGAIAAV